MGRSLIRRARAVLVCALAASLLLFAAPGPASAATIWFAVMTGDQEVPGPGDPSAVGAARLTIDPPGGEVCVQWDVFVEDPATAAHIHAGAEGVAGAVVVALPTPDAEGLGGDCVSGLDEATLQGIVDDPASFYVNVHNATYPAGALRGQLETADVIPNGITVGKMVCPVEIQTSADLLAAPDGTCTPALHSDNVPEPPAGHVLEPPILGFDMDVQLDDLGGTLTLEDTELEGGGACDADSCTYGFSYAWRDAFVGPTTVTELTFPEGFRFGWATFQASFEGADAPAATVDVDGASVSFDTTGFGDSDGFLVVLYDFVDVPAPVPSPILPPPTSTVATEPHAAPITSWLAIGLATVLTLGVILLRQRRTR